MNFTKFDRSNLTNLRAEMQAVLEKYGVSANLDISVGNMKYTEADVEIKVVAKIKGAKTLENIILESRVKSLGLKLTNSRGDKLVDYKPRNYKMPYIYETAAGKRYKCEEAQVLRLFAA